MQLEAPVSSKDRLGSQLSSLFDGYRGPAFSVRLWDGWGWNSAADERIQCTLVVNTPHALLSLASGADEAALGEEFIHKRLDVKGDLFAAFPVIEFLLQRPAGLRHRVAEALLSCAVEVERWFENGLRHSEKRDQASIAYHYDLPVSFYRPWLGETLAYSCAYFRSIDDSLDRAQTQKLDLICRKLRLKRGEHFLDIGCGWGSLVLHAAGQHHAIAHGITLSREQEAVANRRIAQAGLDSRCNVEFRDYRECRELKEEFDKIASVGMYEHVGLSNLPRYFKTVHGLVKPGGVFLNHGIARSQASVPRKNSFIDRYVFPDGKLVTITQAIEAAEGAGFEVRDVENLREHYELTLRKWVEGLKRNENALLKLVPETTYRIWLLYTAGSAAAFHRGDVAVYQVLLSRPDRGWSRLPLLREDWYGGGLCESYGSS
ncbi:MAG TPA: cyclopropane-fatty-acyl-phospholipid synthase family protein [Terriglobia bacterium]|nr:cyclopropane-fatty-acyl-phospholipid synthase family protein [Terriglobia bacterium]